MGLIQPRCAMPSAVGQTLKKMREQTELSVRALARELGMPPSTYSAYEDKFKRDELPIRLVRQLVPIFEGYGIPAEKVWALAGLDEGVGESLPSAASFNAGNMPVMARIEEFDVRAAAGAPTFMDNEADRPTVIHEWQMPRELIRSVTYAPVERVKIITVVGDSMEGTFRPFEKVMVDTQDCTPSPPGIFVVYDGLGLVVKRVEYVPHSDPAVVRITSDNPRYTPYERSLAEAYIQGRVLGRWQWV